MREPQRLLSEFITGYLHNNKIGIQELSDEMEVAYSTVSRWVKGRALPSLEQFAALADATNMDGGSLFVRIFPSSRRELVGHEVEIAEYVRELTHEGQQVADAMLSALVMKYGNKMNEQ